MINYSFLFYRYKGISSLLLAVLIFISISFIPGNVDRQFSEIEIKRAVKRAGIFLQNIQRKDGAICDTLNPLFNSWETILAATALLEIKADATDPVLQRSLSFLQLNENPDRLICHNQKCRMGYCLETSSLYFSLLLKTGDSAAVQERLKKIIPLQKNTGEWDIGNPDVRELKNFPSVTAFVLTLLCEAGKKTILMKPGYDWLLARQNDEGHWGYGWEYYGCPAYALWAAMKALKHIESPAAIVAKEKAVHYINSRQEENGSWLFIEPRYQKQTSSALQTTLMLLALQEAGEKGNPGIIKGVNFLLQQQTIKGNWDGGYFPVPSNQYTKEEYVLATSLAIIVLTSQLKGD